MLSQAKPKVVLRVVDNLNPVDDDGVLLVEHRPGGGGGLWAEEEEGGAGRHYGQHGLRVGQQRLDQV